ncbi:MAG: DUF523 and DUF1722 domain-containing protein [Candidatus Glassbacteria bacterium]
MEDKLRIGIATCLLGEKVRYDGGHKYDPFLVETLGRWVEYVPVCPEYECGLGVPREALRLVGDPENPRLMTIRTGIDLTGRMKQWGRKRLKELEAERLCGYIFKSRSPSSGLERIKVYAEKGVPSNQGMGLWARMFTAHFPALPVQDEGRLHDPALRENFIERIFVMKRWREMNAEGRSLGALVDFHTRHKLLVMSHSVEGYRRLGKLVAAGKGKPSKELFAEYLDGLSEALKLRSTLRKNRNVLNHLLGYFKKELSADEKFELLEVIESYALGHVPLIVPMTLVNHYVRKYGQPYLEKQYYLNPHPLELKLRNHV